MKWRTLVISQLRATWPVLIAVGVVFSLFIGLAIIIHFSKHVPVSVLTRDPVAVMGSPVYTGLISQAGVMLWSAATAACFIAFFVVGKRDDMARFFLGSGLLSLLLGIDDIFLLHEDLLPAIGIPETVTYTIYITATLAWVTRCRSIILTSDFLLLFLAGGCFGISIIFDVLNPDIVGEALYEDGAKLLGILLWMSYFLRTAIYVLSLYCTKAGQPTHLETHPRACIVQPGTESLP